MSTVSQLWKKRNRKTALYVHENILIDTQKKQEICTKNGVLRNDTQELTSRLYR